MLLNAAAFQKSINHVNTFKNSSRKKITYEHRESWQVTYKNLIDYCRNIGVMAGVKGVTVKKKNPNRKTQK